jgi:hypothetical protein
MHFGQRTITVRRSRFTGEVVGCQWARSVDESMHFGERVYRDWENGNRWGPAMEDLLVSRIKA